MRLLHWLGTLLRWGRRPAHRSYGNLPLSVQPGGARAAGTLALVCAALLGGIVPAGSEPAKAGPTDRAPTRIVALGDSLTAGYGLPAGQAFPDKLAQALAARGLAVDIVNAGVSGDTVAGGVTRLDWSVPDGTDAVILELGANDALRGTNPAVTRAGLDTILRRLKARGIEVLLCGMLAPRNLGTDYGTAFDAIYPDLAKAYGLVFYPFFLEGVVMEPKFTQPDGLHPTAAGIDEIVRRILPTVEQLVDRVKKRPER